MKEKKTPEQIAFLNTTPYGLGDKLEPAILGLFQYVVTNETKVVDEWLEATGLALCNEPNFQPQLVGVSVETGYGWKPAVIQIAVDGHILVYSLGGERKEGTQSKEIILPEKLKNVLLSTQVHKTILEVRERALNSVCKCPQASLVKLLAEGTKLGKKYVKMQFLLEDSLGLSPKKNPRIIKSRWSEWPLFKSQEIYAALNAYLNYQVAVQIATELRARGGDLPAWAQANNLESEFKPQVDKIKEDLGLVSQETEENQENQQQQQPQQQGIDSEINQQINGQGNDSQPQTTELLSSSS